MSSKGEISPLSLFSRPLFLKFKHMNPERQGSYGLHSYCFRLFSKDMDVLLTRENKKIKLSSPWQLMAKERSSLDEAFAGDIIAVFDPGIFRIGDTLKWQGTFFFQNIPVFPAEHFAESVLKIHLSVNNSWRGLCNLLKKELSNFINNLISGRKLILWVL